MSTADSTVRRAQVESSGNRPLDASERAELALLRAKHAAAIRGYSAALDEIWALRQLCAHEAQVTAAHVDYKSFPKSRRGAADEQLSRLRAAASGRAQRAVAPISSRVLARALEEAGAPDGLTRFSFEESCSSLGR